MNAKRILPDDAATWTQDIFIAIPVFAYGFVYWYRHTEYSLLGISRELISVRFEDVLFLVFILAASTSIYFSSWTMEVIGSRNKRETLLGFANYIMLIATGIELFSLLSIKLKADKCDFVQWLTFVFQVIMIGIWTVNRRSWYKRVHVNQRARLLRLLIIGIATVYFALQLGCYLFFHLSKYQICEQDQALVAGFDGQGRAIEKSIISIDERGVCTVGEGYTLVDITDKKLHVEAFSYIDVRIQDESESPGVLGLAGEQESENR